ncbi:serine hydrolase domain-containing protein [Kitasatospora aureofaciens]|uniref:serine hydrolase domain-containing protein n=1 Tax=Kitasatospora aureofaciens TaxID=1894 RepID=UPI00068AD48E|nr:serine hydrolase domain-containing protein [Kitasatospora aureofaciens]HJD84702.1 beta-lactamase family protein [Kitasatospora aureofaciens]
MAKTSLLRPLAVTAAAVLVAGGTTPAMAADRGGATLPTPDTAGVLNALQATTGAGAPGAFAVIRDHGDDDRTRSLAVGRANLDGTPMNSAWRFRVGSNSKLFAAVLVMQLAQEGRIDLDKPLRDYLPAGTLPEGWTMTGRQVMEHRAGVYDHTDDLLEQPGEETTSAFEARIRSKVYAPADLVAMSVKHGQQYAPGSRYSYSNTDFVLMGLAVEHLTGRPYADVLRERIIEPLRLKRTSFVVPRQRIAGAHITGYLTNDDRSKPLLDSTQQTGSWVWSAGAVISSAEDLDTFLTALMAGSSGGLVSDDSLRQMEAALPTPTAKISYGLGLRRITLSCGDVYGHGGIVQGYQTQSFTTPDGHRSVVVFANASNNGSVTQGLMNALEPAFCGKKPAAAPRTAFTPAARDGGGDQGDQGDQGLPVVEDTRI